MRCRTDCWVDGDFQLLVRGPASATSDTELTNSDSDFKVTFKTSLLLPDSRQILLQLKYDSIKKYLKTFITRPKHIYTVQFDYVIARCGHAG